ILTVMAVYFAAAVIGVVLWDQCRNEEKIANSAYGGPGDATDAKRRRNEEKIANSAYGAYKDLIPLVIAIPATWLAFCIQKRLSYVQQLRALWTKVIDAVQDSINYTYLTEPKQEDHRKVVSKLFAVIDEIRGVFRNVGDKPHWPMRFGTREKRTREEIGLYPLEGVKEIRDYVVSLGSGGAFSPSQARSARGKIIALWNHVRDTLLTEFDRSRPTYADSPYLIPESKWETAPSATPPPPPAQPPAQPSKYTRLTLLVPLLELDARWKEIVALTGKLGLVAKVYPAMPGRSKYPGQRAIYIDALPAAVPGVQAELTTLGVTWGGVSVGTFATHPPGDSLTEVRQLAFAKWVAAGRPEGDGKCFWLEAERELGQKAG
ncbi:MAG TPA: DUF2934 domain-containing protein, partial [Gemmata sp.]|nr:DUF2934 domain-containing protein [Gemmata sp.]